MGVVEQFITEVLDGDVTYFFVVFIFKEYENMEFCNMAIRM